MGNQHFQDPAYTYKNKNTGQTRDPRPKLDSYQRYQSWRDSSQACKT